MVLTLFFGASINMAYTKTDYREDRKLLDDLNRRIDEAPSHAKPVFQGIATLHARVHQYERKNGLESHQ